MILLKQGNSLRNCVYPSDNFSEHAVVRFHNDHFSILVLPLVQSTVRLFLSSAALKTPQAKPHYYFW